MSVHNSMRHFGYTHYHVEQSKLIRQGLTTREEALRALAFTYDEAILDEILAPLSFRFGGGGATGGA